MLNEIEIGETAERVRQYLGDCGASTPRRINKALKLDVVLSYMAIRRLAREDKIVFSDRGKALKISLAGEHPLIAICKALASGSGTFLTARKPRRHAMEGGRS